jgi:Zn-dependent protease with chaperone function
MNFFERQEAARVRARNLVWLFHLVVFLTALATALFYVVAIKLQFFFVYTEDFTYLSSYFTADTLLVFITVYVMIWAIALIRRSGLKLGGHVVAEMLGAQEVKAHSKEIDHKKLRNIVEEMSIAAGMPIPRIYILNDNSINAFASGYGFHDACVTVTKGSIEKLTREELQGVVAHEFSHILNGDMKLNLELLGYLYGLTSISDLGRMLLRDRSRSNRKNNSLPLLGLGLFIIGSFGYFLGLVLKAAVSRDKERLADASAVQFTRNPEGLGGALRKIWQEQNLAFKDSKVNEISYFFFHWPVRFLSFLSTHPPITERLKALNVTPSAASRVSRKRTIHSSEIQESVRSLGAMNFAASMYLWLEPSAGLGPIDSIEKNMMDHDKIKAGFHLLTQFNGIEHFEYLEASLDQLKSLQKIEKVEFLRSVKTMIESDKKVTVREFLFYELLQRELFPEKFKVETIKDKKISFALNILVIFFTRILPLELQQKWIERGEKEFNYKHRMNENLKIKDLSFAFDCLSHARPILRPRVYNYFSAMFDDITDKKGETFLSKKIMGLILEIPTDTSGKILYQFNK